MEEKLLHFLWKYRQYDINSLITHTGEPVEIIDPGKENNNAGPDFFNAKIKIGNTLWAGNVEIHINSSDWNKHHHEKDESYNSVILHVCSNIDAPVFNKKGREVEQIQLNIPQHVKEKYLHLSQQPIKCTENVSEISDLLKISWLSSLLTERLEEKTNQIFSFLKQNKNNWEETFYIILARNFGFSVNAQPFEMLARSLPLAYLSKHKNNLTQLEALLFGQAGMLEEDTDDTYFNELKKEYHFLKKKFKLVPIEKHQWKMLRIHPENFPYIRLAQFAAIIHQSTKLFSKIIQYPDIESISTLFLINTSAYWDAHYTVGKTSPVSKKKLGKSAIHVIIINTIVPFLFAYGKAQNNEQLKEKAIHILEQLPPEKNHIITYWKHAGISPQHAYDTQALLQLYKKYCNNAACFSCRFGHKLLTVLPNL